MVRPAYAGGGPPRPRTGPDRAAGRLSALRAVAVVQPLVHPPRTRVERGEAGSGGPTTEQPRLGSLDGDAAEEDRALDHQRGRTLDGLADVLDLGPAEDVHGLVADVDAGRHLEVDPAEAGLHVELHDRGVEVGLTEVEVDATEDRRDLAAGPHPPAALALDPAEPRAHAVGLGVAPVPDDELGRRGHRRGRGPE